MSAALLQYQQTLVRRQQLYDLFIASGKATPFIYPWDTLPALYLFGALVFGPRLSLRWNRMLNLSTFVAVGSHVMFICTHRRSVGMASGYGIGLSMVWGVIMTGVLLLVHGGARDYARLEWRDKDKSSANGRASIHSQVTAAHEENELHQRQVNGSTTKKTSSDVAHNILEPNDQKLVWQPFPMNSIYHTIDWTLDLMTSFRGPNWNFRLPILPPINAPLLEEKSIKLTRSINTDQTKSLEGTSRSIPKSTFEYESIRNFVLLYLLIDVIKAAAITDPYFLGLTSMSTPSPWAFVHKLHELTDLPIGFLTQLTRLFFTLPAVITALSFIFSLCPLFFYTVLPRIVDPKKFTYSPLTSQWQYPPFFHSLFPTIADKGLNGLWGKSWHQMFRIGFSESSVPILKYFNVKPRSQLERTIQLLVAFGLSGSIHGTASYTTFSILPSKPYMPILFFILQAVGITLQTVVADFITKTLKITPPRIVRRITNTAFVLVWGYFTGPLLADDFARCGIWLFEPLPVSFVRPLMGGRFWQWQGLTNWIAIWRGVQGKNSWYDQGIAIL